MHHFAIFEIPFIPNHTAMVYIIAIMSSSVIDRYMLSVMLNTLQIAAERSGVARENVVAIPANIAKIAIISIIRPRAPSILSLNIGRHASEKRCLSRFRI